MARTHRYSCGLPLSRVQRPVALTLRIASTNISVKYIMTMIMIQIYIFKKSKNLHDIMEGANTTNLHDAEAVKLQKVRFCTLSIQLVSSCALLYFLNAPNSAVFRFFFNFGRSIYTLSSSSVCSESVNESGFALRLLNASNSTVSAVSLRYESHSKYGFHFSISFSIRSK